MHQAKQGQLKGGRWWILGGLAALLLVLAVGVGALLPIWVVRWLGGKDFQRLVSQQVSSILKTEGEFEPLEWSSFSVYSPGFSSRPGASGPWLWNIREIRTEISPRLLFDRILRFPEITMGSLEIKPGSSTALPSEMNSRAASSSGSGGDLFRDVQIGKIEVLDFRLRPGTATSGWGIQGTRVLVKPGKQKTEFELQNGEILNPFPYVGRVDLVKAKGRYVDPTIFLTEMEIKGKNGGTLQISGEGAPTSPPKAQGRVSWDRWPVPGGRIGVGLFEIPATMSGEFSLREWRPGGPVGSGQVRLVDARLEPGKGSETILGLLAALTGEARLRGCPLTTAQATWDLQPGVYDVREILAEAPGLLRAVGRVRVVGQSLNGQIQLGLEQNLGQKVNALTGGECFTRMEGGYLYQSIQISGTLNQPKNDLQPRLTMALTRTAIRTGAQIFEKAAGAQGGSGGDAAGQAVNVLKTLFGPAK